MDWNKFFHRNQNKAFAIAISYLRNKEDAFDCVQDAMMSMYKSYLDIDNEEDAKKLFYKILNNKLTDKYRSLKRIWNNFTETEEDIADLALSDDDDFPLIMSIEKSFKKITKIQQRVFLLKSIENFTFKEIAEIISTTESTAKTHYQRAIKKIKEDVI